MRGFQEVPGDASADSTATEELLVPILSPKRRSRKTTPRSDG